MLKDFVLQICALDDDDFTRMEIMECLSYGPPCIVEAYETSKEFFEHFGRFTDIAIVDNKLSDGSDGFEVLKQIRSVHRACRVIIITGNQDMRLAMDYYNNGAFRVQLKHDKVFKQELKENVNLAYQELKYYREFFEEGIEFFKKKDVANVAIIPGNT